MTVEIGNAVSAYKAAVNRLKESSEGGPAASSFSSMVKNFAEAAIKTGEKSERISAAAAAGKADINQVVVAVAEAELTLNMVTAVRDKVIEAYRQIIQMPL